MCLLVLAVDSHPEFSLVVAENRDEFYNRPTRPAGFWEEDPDLLAGLDLERGGTWFGVSRRGRWAAVTNYRDFHHRRYSRLSRGALVSRFLSDGESIDDVRQMLEQDDGHYAGLNFLAGDGCRTLYFSNTGGDCRYLEPGVYGLSNHWLDTGWPKVEGAKSDFKAWLDSGSTAVEPLFELLADRRQATDELLPDTGVGLEWERLLSSRFIQSPDYGTRASTLFLVDRQGSATFLERSFDTAGDTTETRRFSFELPRFRAADDTKQP